MTESSPNAIRASDRASNPSQMVMKTSRLFQAFVAHSSLIPRRRKRSLCRRSTLLVDHSA